MMPSFELGEFIVQNLKDEMIQKSQNWSDWLEHEIKKVRKIKWVAHVEHHNNIEVSGYMVKPAG